MSSRKNPWKRIGRPDYEGVHHMPFDTKNRAITHELNRQRVITQILLDLYCMAVVGLIDKDGRVVLKGAGSQNLIGSKTDKTEAAHCAPRQIIVGGRRPQDILFTHFPERALALDSLFAETDILPANFNKSDSRAERNGLKDAFCLACQSVLTSAHLDGQLEYIVINSAIKKAFSIYSKKANEAFNASLSRLKKKIGTSGNAHIKRIVFSDEKKKWQEQYAITKFYMEALQNNSLASGSLEMHRVNGMIKIYNMI